MTNTDLTSNERLAEFLSDEFFERGYKWNFGTEVEPDLRIPTPEDMLEAFKELKRTTPEGSFQIAGHLVAIHWQDKFDIYTHVGEIE